MKNLTAVIVVVGIAILGCFVAAENNPRDLIAPSDHHPIYHVVSLKFKPQATPAQIHEVEQAFANLKKSVPGITSLHWGTNISPEKLNKGFTHCFVLTFDNEKDRDAYLVHPEHKAFGKTLGPILGEVMVIDFKAEQ